MQRDLLHLSPDNAERSGGKRQHELALLLTRSDRTERLQCDRARAIRLPSGTTHAERERSGGVDRSRAARQGGVGHMRRLFAFDAAAGRRRHGRCYERDFSRPFWFFFRRFFGFFEFFFRRDFDFLARWRAFGALRVRDVQFDRVFARARVGVFDRRRFGFEFGAVTKAPLVLLDQAGGVRVFEFDGLTHERAPRTFERCRRGWRRPGHEDLFARFGCRRRRVEVVRFDRLLDCEQAFVFKFVFDRREPELVGRVCLGLGDRAAREFPFDLHCIALLDRGGEGHRYAGSHWFFFGERFAVYFGGRLGDACFGAARAARTELDDAGGLHAFRFFAFDRAFFFFFQRGDLFAFPPFQEFEAQREHLPARAGGDPHGKFDQFLEFRLQRAFFFMSSQHRLWPAGPTELRARRTEAEQAGAEVDAHDRFFASDFPSCPDRAFGRDRERSAWAGAEVV